MKKYFSIFFALLAIVGMANAVAVEPESGSLVEKTEYSIPGTGNSFDKYYTCSETLAEGQTIVVFYYSHEPGVLMKVPFYFGPGGKNPLSTTKTEVDAEGNKVMDVTIRNRGNVHQILLDSVLTVSDANGNKVVLNNSEDLVGIDSINILARKTITKTIAWPEKLPFVEGGSYTGSLSYSD